MITTTVKWDKVCRGTKIYLEKDMILKSFNNETREVKSGFYFITGFWLDIVGLSKISASSLNDVGLKYKELNNFVK